MRRSPPASDPRAGLVGGRGWHEPDHGADAGGRSRPRRPPSDYHAPRIYSPTARTRSRSPWGPSYPFPIELHVAEADPCPQSTSRSYDQSWTPASPFAIAKLATVSASPSVNCSLLASFCPIIGVSSMALKGTPQV